METYVILAVSRKLHKELRNQRIVVLGRLRIISLVVTTLRVVGIRETNTTRLLDEHQVSDFVPRIRVQTGVKINCQIKQKNNEHVQETNLKERSLLSVRKGPNSVKNPSSPEPEN